MLLPRGRHEVSVVDGITSLTSSIIEKAFVNRLPRVGERLWLGGCGSYTTALSNFWVYDPLPTLFQAADGQLQADLPASRIAEARTLPLGL